MLVSQSQNAPSESSANLNGRSNSRVTVSGVGFAPAGSNGAVNVPVHAVRSNSD